MSARTPLSSPRRRFTSIPGFSDRADLPRLGKLRLGIKKQGNRGDYPAEVDYFVFDPSEGITPEIRKELLDRFHAKYGARPAVLTDVYLPSSVREDVFSQSYEWWGKGKRLCNGDGNEADRLNKESGEYEAWSPCANNGCLDYLRGDCKLSTRLRVMLPEISVAGYVQLDTGSVYSSANIRDGINLLQVMAGRVNGIPLVLARVPQQIVWQGKANTHYIVHLRIPNITASAMKELTSSPLALAAPVAPLDIDDDDMPLDNVPASEHEEPAAPDPAIEEAIATGFAMLNLNSATRASLASRFGNDRLGLLDHLKDEYRKKKEVAAV